ncbi:MAG: class I SAM-dependent methyltransferase [Nannocystaceae bacterium]
MRNPQRLWRRHCDAVHVDLLSRWLPKRLGSVLKTDLFDEASGEGLTPWLCARAESVTGVDLSKKVIDLARGRHAGLVTVLADVRELPFPAESFDVVVSNSTLDHFDEAADVDVALGELQRVLRPGGVLVLTLDNLDNPVVWIRNLLPPSLLRRAGLIPYHVGPTLGPVATASHLAAKGFEIGELCAVSHCPRLPAIAMASCFDRWGGRLAQQRFLRGLMAWERLSAWPTWQRTGYYVAARARKTV